MKWRECKDGMRVRDIRNGNVYQVIGSRGVTEDGAVTATDCGAWVEQITEGPDGVKDVWVIHWSHLEPVNNVGE